MVGKTEEIRPQKACWHKELGPVPPEDHREVKLCGSVLPRAHNEGDLRALAVSAGLRTSHVIRGPYSLHFTVKDLGSTEYLFRTWPTTVHESGKESGFCPRES